MATRISRDELYMQVAHVFAKRSTCARGQVGCVIVQGRHIIGAGYNGAPPGMPHCPALELPAKMKPTIEEWKQCGGEGDHQGGIWFPNGCTRSIHAELNAIAFSARHGTRTDGAVLYCTHAMCRPCAQAVASAGIVAVTYETPYRDEAGLHLLNEAGIEVFKYGST